MNQEAIFHMSHGAYAYALGPNHAVIKLRAKRGELKSVNMVHEDRFELPGSYATQELNYAGSDELYDYFTAVVETKTKRLRYRFLLDDGASQHWYGERSLSDVADFAGWFQLAYLPVRDLFLIPEWAKSAIVYQIFPDRFQNGNPSIDPEGVRPWGELPTANTFFGGDLQGILDKLPYLENLGVNLIYLTPIFTSPSTHKYDTADYYQIDPVFGDLETFKRLVDNAHVRGIRVMLDAVFNHCGAEFAPFQDVLEKGEASEYADWFHIHSFPVNMEEVNYETFANHVPTMPKLRTENLKVRDYLLDVAEYWVKEIGIDGWRLDVANEVDHAFWREFRDRVRMANPDALIIGEVWNDASPWLQGDQFDGVMNYLFRDAVIEFFAKRTISADRFDAMLTKTRMMYKRQANLMMFNLLGSHDTARFLTICHGREERMRLAVVFQMTYVGLPELYYGDEIGMMGETDPDCRRTMIWEEERQNREMFRLHQQLIAIRKSHPALQLGSYRAVEKDALHNLYGFVRESQGESIYVLLNNGNAEMSVTLPIGVSGRDLLTGRIYSGMLELEAYGFRILLLSGGTV
ncbi:glycoside hydrolase family 13 protein [Tumebacillus permanentifrigoris]|uniref:Glycosidase n=1 Tax=Tumebacillus permanentifrigoris TaxID=378543 RepID=A0A316D5G3_9BACL|nr:glycoside hydrolase family 13 protein [Tumebacillus permanentifrigoris]PWK06004.1 glycosidase [Tumebacillus permanentifrigoris]